MGKIPLGMQSSHRRRLCSKLESSEMKHKFSKQGLLSLSTTLLHANLDKSKIEG